jgi:hypothetical protein
MTAGRPDPPDVAGLSFDEAWRLIAMWFREPRTVSAGHRSVGLVELELDDWTLGDASEAALHEPKVWTLAFLRGAMRSRPFSEDPTPEPDPVDRAEWEIVFDFADHDGWTRVTQGPAWSWESCVGWFMVGSDGADAGELIDAFDDSDVARAARSSDVLAVREYDKLSRSSD